MNADWAQAMQQELNALIKSKWKLELTHLFEGEKAISSKWVYKTKLKLDGNIERFGPKVCLVAKGYNHI